MPRLDFDKKNKRESTNYDYPVLKLKKGESARIILLEQPHFEWVHTLRKHSLVDGKPVTFENERRNGQKYTDYKKDFVSTPICLGDDEVIGEQGSDPSACPICALAKEGDLADAPKRRFAMHVVRYRTKGTTLVTPFSVDTVVWKFAESVFNKISDFKDEWGDLRKHDLILGPCENEMFQKMDIQVGQKAEWLVDDDRKKRTLETFAGQQIPDLSIACGSRKERKWIEQDIASIKEAYYMVQAAENKGAPAQAAQPAQSMDQQIAGLMGDLGSPTQPRAAQPEAKVDETVQAWNTPTGGAAGGDELDSLFADAPAATAAPEQDSSPAPQEKTASAPAGDLDDLLASINLD